MAKLVENLLKFYLEIFKIYFECFALIKIFYCTVYKFRPNYYEVTLNHLFVCFLFRSVFNYFVVRSANYLAV